MIVIDGLREEVELLHRVVADTAVLARPTPFAGWTGADVLVHLAFVDRMAVLTLTDESGYDTELAAFGEATAGASAAELHDRMSAFEHTRVAGDPASLAARWRAGADQLCEVASGRDDHERVRWFGRELSVERLVVARQMEVFAYGQDVVDGSGAVRPATDRLEAVADFAVRTRAFSFRNRGLPVPEPEPHVRLVAPSGTTWTWGDESSAARVEGDGAQFCLVATRRRHPADTDLQATGPGAAEWLRVAQTIAGPPDDGPAPGPRGGSPGG